MAFGCLLTVKCCVPIVRHHHSRVANERFRQPINVHSFPRANPLSSRTKLTNKLVIDLMKFQLLSDRNVKSYFQMGRGPTLWLGKWITNSLKVIWNAPIERTSMNRTFFWPRWSRAAGRTNQRMAALRDVVLVFTTTKIGSRRKSGEKNSSWKQQQNRRSNGFDRDVCERLRRRHRPTVVLITRRHVKQSVAQHPTSEQMETTGFCVLFIRFRQFPPNAVYSNPVHRLNT